MVALEVDRGQVGEVGQHVGGQLLDEVVIGVDLEGTKFINQILVTQ